MAAHKLLLASVLKPIDDTRMYEKFARSLAKIDNLEIYVAGQIGKAHEPNGKIHFYPVFDFGRLSLKRLFAGFEIGKILLKVKPDIFIANTHELLVVVVLYKILFGGVIIYDIQENYYKNIRYGGHYPLPFNMLIAWYVRLKERILFPFLTQCLLAEMCYISEMPYLKPKALTIENKFLPPVSYPAITDRKPLNKRLDIIYTGTIGKTYGIFEAIELAKELLNALNGTFTIIGYCPDKNVLRQVKAAIEGYSNIELTGGDQLVPHPDILRKIEQSNLGIISYQKNPALVDKIPTRMYEYLACQLPFLLTDNPVWVSYCQRYEACIAVDYSNPDPEAILKSINNSSFYSKKPGSEIYWYSEEEKLLKNIRALLPS